MLQPECEAGRAAWPVFLRTSVLVIDVLDRELRAAVGLQLTWFDVLAQLSKTSDGRMPMKQLAANILLSKSGITRLVDRMETAGLIRRDSCATDGRVVYATLTPQGRKIFREAAPLAFKGVEEHFARHVTQKEAESLVAILSKILRAEDGRSGWLEAYRGQHARLIPIQEPAGASSPTGSPPPAYRPG